MGVFKDKLFIEVWRFLLKQRDKSMLLSSLNAPREGRHDVRAAWKEICDNRPAEGLKAKTGMRDVLYDRPDLFNMSGPQQHPVVHLTELAISLDPRDGLPAYGAPEPDFSMVGSTLPPVLADGEEPDMAGGYFEDDEDDAGGVAGGAADSGGLAQPMKAGRLSSGLAGLQSDQMASLASFLGVGGGGGGAPAEPAAPTLTGPTTTKKVGKVKKEIELTAKNILPSARWDFSFPNWNMRNNCYGDIVWTPAIGAEKHAAEKKEWALCRAVFKVIQLYGGGPVQMTQACSHYTVQAVKKEPSFKTMKMVDFCRLYPDVFELIPDSTGGGFMAKLVPGAEEALPGDAADAANEEDDEMMKSLPKFIMDAETAHDKLQALRIEIIHSLANRGSKLQLTDIGQDPRVQKAKSLVTSQKKVTEYIRMFPMNFRISDAPPLDVELVSTDVTDTGPISAALRQPAFRDMPGMAKGGGGKGSYSSAPPSRLALPAPRRSPPRRSPPRRSPPRRREPSRGRRDRSRSRRRRERTRSRSRRGGGGGGRDRDRDRDRRLSALD
eukprot:TRINITY_DN10949_c0_g2_i7.p1 TRINITY_DN10949_c0_g2~~TRINITY_DN10949_c0_g2_i7.p1  ORF type:complete len:551 (-),score=106.26 TRINITY_DN10949_c0_g2_i7:324-1976(-)